MDPQIRFNPYIGRTAFIPRPAVADEPVFDFALRERLEQDQLLWDAANALIDGSCGREDAD
jgi:hypothetical protein